MLVDPDKYSGGDGLENMHLFLWMGWDDGARCVPNFVFTAVLVVCASCCCFFPSRWLWCWIGCQPFGFFLVRLHFLHFFLIFFLRTPTHHRTPVASRPGGLDPADGGSCEGADRTQSQEDVRSRWDNVEPAQRHVFFFTLLHARNAHSFSLSPPLTYRAQGWPSLGRKWP